MEMLNRAYMGFASLMTRGFQDIALLFMRLIVAKVFLDSGRSKWDGFFDFNEGKYDLFRYEFFCADPPRDGALQLCDPQTLDYEEGSSILTAIDGMAVFAGVAEVVFPILLIIGLFTRVSAAMLLGMTLFIQLAVFPTWDHWLNQASWWFVVLLGVMAIGPGRLSLDSWLKLDGRPLISGRQ